MTDIKELKGTVSFKLVNEGSKSEVKKPFLLLEDGKNVPLFMENSNPFENSALHQYENKRVQLKGYEKKGVLVVTEIAVGEP